MSTHAGLYGTYVALVTPFKNGQVDEPALRALVDFVIDGGVEGVIPCGTTGESVTLSHHEHTEVVRIVVEQTRKRAKVFAGTGSVSTAHAVELSVAAERVGADGLLLVCPYYNKPTQKGLAAHFRAIAAACSLPAILYNIPGRTGVDMALETLESLADVPSIVGMKEATGNVMRSQQILARCGDRFAVFSGDDALTLPVMSVGGVGVISVTANVFPKETSDMVRLCLEGKWNEARSLHLRMLPVHESMFVEANPGPVKAVLAQRGLIQKEVRLPLVWPEESNMNQTFSAIIAAGLEASIKA